MNYPPPPLLPIPDIIGNQSINNRRVQPAPSNRLHKRTKSDQLLDSLVNYLIYPEMNGSRIFLRRNILGTKYVIKDDEIIFFGEDKLIERLKADAYFQINENMSDKVIKSALQIISGRQGIWLYDTEEDRITPIRTIPMCTSGFIYFFDIFYNVANNNYYYYHFRTYIPKGMLDIQRPADHNFINAPIINDYKSSPGFDVLKALICNHLNISEDNFIIVLTWLVQSIASNNYTLLELVGESKTGKSFTQSILRELVDPNVELMTKAPKKLLELEKQTMEGHVISYDDVEILRDEMQLFMADLMSVNGVKINYPIEKKDFSGDIFVRRPIILNSVVPVVTHERLQSKTITIELKVSEEISSDYKIRDVSLINYARLELLKLAKAVYDINTNHNIPRCTYADLSDFSKIGLKLSQIIYSSTSIFSEQLSLLIKEQIIAKLEENHTGYLVFLWATNNPNADKDMSVTNWIDQLEGFHHDRLGNWKITPKQFGCDLKRAAPILRKFGINCRSLGKRGSFVRWTITTTEKIDLQVSFFE